MYKTISRLENENYLLKSDANYLKEETLELEKKEQMLVDNCVNELGILEGRGFEHILKLFLKYKYS